MTRRQRGRGGREFATNNPRHIETHGYRVHTMRKRFAWREHTPQALRSRSSKKRNQRRSTIHFLPRAYSNGAQCAHDYKRTCCSELVVVCFAFHKPVVLVYVCAKCKNAPKTSGHFEENRRIDRAKNNIPSRRRSPGATRAFPPAWVPSESSRHRWIAFQGAPGPLPALPPPEVMRTVGNAAPTSPKTSCFERSCNGQ